MSKKSAKATPKSAPTPNEIVAAWHKEFVKALKPWSIKEGKDLDELKGKLENKITALLGVPKTVFGPADMRGSRRVAKDAAKICKILQPHPAPKVVPMDTLQLVLRACAKSHEKCKGPGGGGGWCDT